jgi:hypothetical protein
MKCRDELTKYFDFEDVGILFRDTNTNNLFTIEMIYNEYEIKFLKDIENKKLKGIALTIEERITDFER